MFDSPQAIWRVFILGLVAVVGCTVRSHRRDTRLHRTRAKRVLEAPEAERAWLFPDDRSRV